MNRFSCVMLGVVFVVSLFCGLSVDAQNFFFQKREDGGPFPARDKSCAKSRDVPTFEEGNLSRAADAVAFGTEGVGGHSASFIIDGRYGGRSAWVANLANAAEGVAYVGVLWEDEERFIQEVAFGSDATQIPIFNTSSDGSHTLQFTTDVFDPTDEFDIASASWITLGKRTAVNRGCGRPSGSIERTGRVKYRIFDCGDDPGCNAPSLGITARAFRLITKDNPLGTGGNRIDELELGKIEVCCVRDGEDFACDQGCHREPWICQTPLTIVEEGGPCPDIEDPDNTIHPNAESRDVLTFGEGNLAREPGAVGFAPDSYPVWNEFNEGGEPRGFPERINDGAYSSPNEWPAGAPGLATGLNYAGVLFPDVRRINQIAFQRDATGAFPGRHDGDAVVEYTTDEFTLSPILPTDSFQDRRVKGALNDEAVATATWICIGRAADFTQTRVKYEFPGGAVDARAVRVIIVGDNFLDEIEVGDNMVASENRCEPLDLPTLDTLLSGGPCDPPVQRSQVPSATEGNIARTFDAVPFASPAQSTPEAVRQGAPNLNDGVYGPEKWLAFFPGESTGEYYFGMAFSELNEVEEIAFGADATQGSGGNAAGEHTIWVTSDEIVADIEPIFEEDAFSERGRKMQENDAKVAQANWTPVGKVQAQALRHKYALPDAMSIRAIKIITERNNVIDELEVGGPVLDPDDSCQPDAPCANLQLREMGGPLPFDVTPGCFPINPRDVPTAAEGNLSRATDASVFGTAGSSGADVSATVDGVYGLNNSWRAAGVGFLTADAYVGVYWRDGNKSLEEVALGCSNVEGEAPICSSGDGQSGLVRVEWTEDENVDRNGDGTLDDEEVGLVSWQCAGQAPLDVGGLRHRYTFPVGPITARAVRIKVDVGVRLDEVELGAPLDLGEREGEDYLPLTLIEDVVPPAVPGADEGNLSIEGTAFASTSANSSAAPVSGLNNGLYGTASGNSWFAGKRESFSHEAYVGIEFATAQMVEGIAIGANSCTGDSDVCGTGGNASGTQWVQYTDEDFVSSSDNSVSNVTWHPVGKITADVLRKRYEFDEPVLATAIRVLVRGQPQGTGGDTVDELEFFGDTVVVSPTGACCTDGVCGDAVTQAACEAEGGEYQGDDTDCESAMCSTATEFRRGDCDQSGKLDFNDAIFHLRFLFLGENDAAVESCRDACDSDDSGEDDFTDDINSLRFLFLGQGSIPDPGPFPDESHPCGIDPTDADVTGCETYSPTVACP